MTEPLLRVQGLRSVFDADAGPIVAVDGISFDLAAGEILGLVGESGSGKSVTALSIMRLLPDGVARISGGEVRFEDRDLAQLSALEMRRVRGAGIAMIFQEPMTSLNPLQRIGRQIAEPLVVHRGVSWAEGVARAVALLRRVGIPDPEQRARSFPHELSGGMRQRAMIAMALACEPKLLIADEPTTALDVTIQAQILHLMRELQQRYGMAIILITHDLGVVAETADRVVVMYAGRKVEEATVAELFERPGHPYTEGLMGSIPSLDDAARPGDARSRLNEIKGMVPSLAKLPKGCSFAPRCTYATEQCRADTPDLVEMRRGHWVACWNAEQLLGARP